MFFSGSNLFDFMLSAVSWVYTIEKTRMYVERTVIKIVMVISYSAVTPGAAKSPNLLTHPDIKPHTLCPQMSSAAVVQTPCHCGNLFYIDLELIGVNCDSVVHTCSRVLFYSISAWQRLQLKTSLRVHLRSKIFPLIFFTSFPCLLLQQRWITFRKLRSQTLVFLKHTEHNDNSGPPSLHPHAVYFRGYCYD